MLVGRLRNIASRADAAGARTILLTTYKPVAAALHELLNRKATPVDRAARTAQDLLNDLLYPGNRCARRVDIRYYGGDVTETNEFATVDMTV